MSCVGRLQTADCPCLCQAGAPLLHFFEQDVVLLPRTFTGMQIGICMLHFRGTEYIRISRHHTYYLLYHSIHTQTAHANNAHRPLRGGRKEYQTIADAMVESGMVAAGYTLLSTVCTDWIGRDPVTNELQENLTLWPGGRSNRVWCI